jgi:hypothetical protein
VVGEVFFVKKGVAYCKKAAMLSGVMNNLITHTDTPADYAGFVEACALLEAKTFTVSEAVQKKHFSGSKPFGKKTVSVNADGSFTLAWNAGYKPNDWDETTLRFDCFGNRI